MNVRNLTCNNAGQVTSIRDALLNTTLLTYDGYDLYSITDPLSRTVTSYRDNLGRTIGVQDSLGNKAVTEYDVMDRVTATTSPKGERTQYGYDYNGNRTSMLDARGQTVTWSYDNRDRVSSRIDQLVKTRGWTYDGLGDVLTYTDRKNQQTTLHYDTLARLDKATYADAATVNYYYDASNRLTQMADSLSGSINRNWDGRNRLSQESSPQGTVNYLYDATSRRTSLQVGSNTATTYAYDDANRLTQIIKGAETVAFAYDDANRRSSLTLPNGISTIYGYDNADQILGLTYKFEADNGYNFRGTGGALYYAYDTAGRRTSATAFSPEETIPLRLNLDPLPNATTSDYNYNAANQLTGGNGYSITYDANGDMLSDGKGNSYTWDVRRRLIRINQGPVIVASFQYDTTGRRISRTDASGLTTAYLYDGLNPIQETQGSTVRSILTGLGIDERYARDDTGGRTYFLTDALGSTVALTNASRAVVQQYAYDPYGNVTLSNPSSTLTNQYQYTGRENDGNGLYYYRARYYSPNLQRFVSEDPIGLAGGINQFAYVGGNPVSRIDPRGLFYIDPRGGADDTGGMSSQPVSPDTGAIAAAIIVGGLMGPEFPAALAALARGLRPNPEGLPPRGVKPPVENPEQCTTGPSTRGDGSSTWDKNGGEWRHAPEDSRHNPHWDYNPWNSWNSQWENVPIGDLPPIKPQP